MSRNTVVQLAQASWIVPLAFAFGRVFVGMFIGGLLADLLVFALCALALPLALFCLIQIREHGRRGILGHAIAGTVVCALLLGIFVSNCSAAQGRSAAAAPPHSSITR